MLLYEEGEPTNQLLVELCKLAAVILRISRPPPIKVELTLWPCIEKFVKDEC